MIHATRRRAVCLLVVLAFVAVGCSRGGSGDPTVKGMVGRGNNWGKAGVVSFAKPTKIKKGTWKCTASVDKSAKTATTECTGTSTTGQPVTFHAVSTFDELKKRRSRALPGKIEIKVGGKVVATPSCVGAAC